MNTRISEGTTSSQRICKEVAEMKFTPGPWIYAHEYGPAITELPRITTVARCAQFVIGIESDYPGGNYRDGDPCGDEEADARLISAAPDLFEALRNYVSVIAAAGGGDKALFMDAIREADNAAREAIAKVTP